MAWEQVKLNELEQWVQDLPSSYDGVRTLADFFVHDIAKYPEEARRTLLEEIVADGWRVGYDMMVRNFEVDDDEEAIKSYEEARKFTENYYKGRTEEMDSAIETVMKEFFVQVFQPKQ